MKCFVCEEGELEKTIEEDNVKYICDNIDCEHEISKRNLEDVNIIEISSNDYDRKPKSFLANKSFRYWYYYGGTPLVEFVKDRLKKIENISEFKFFLSSIRDSDYMVKITSEEKNESYRIALEFAKEHDITEFIADVVGLPEFMYKAIV